MPCVIYVANITDGDLSYMLRARTYDTKGNLLSRGGDHQRADLVRRQGARVCGPLGAILSPSRT